MSLKKRKKEESIGEVKENTQNSLNGKPPTQTREIP